MLGGGSFTIQNKVFPGAYVNFVSAVSAEAKVGGRGTAIIPMVLGWGPEKSLFEVTKEEFYKNAREIFGCSMDDPDMLPMRELFRNMTKGIFYRLNEGTGAANEYATAKYTGVRGNQLKTVIVRNADDEDKFEVKTLFEGRVVDSQTVGQAQELSDNAYVSFNKLAVLQEVAGLNLTGGVNGPSVMGEDYEEFLEKAESASFQILCCPCADGNVKALFTAFTRRMREENGIKFQTVLHRYVQADHEGIISVENEADQSETGLVYWVAGAQAACAVNKTNENKAYDGEYTVKTSYTQLQLADAMKAGRFLFHKVGEEVRVLADINTLVSYTEEKGEDFSGNQTVRVLDQIGNDIAALFNNRYLGKISNDEAGRIGLWNDIVTYGKQLAVIRAIEAVNPEEVKVEKGQGKKSVVVNFPVKPVNCMSILYMTIVVS